MKHDLEQMRDEYVRCLRVGLVRMSRPGNGYGDVEPLETFLRFNGDCTREVIR